MDIPNPTFSLNHRCLTIDQQIALLKDQVLMDSEECVRIETNIMADLKPLMLAKFKHCELHTFGSMKTGLALKGSDLDVYADVVDPWFSSNLMPNRVTLENCVYKCADALLKEKSFGSTEAIAHATVPIISTIHLPSKTKCDISFSSSLGIEQSKLLRFYLNLNPRFFDVMLVIKFWAKTQGICCGRNTISSYAWTLLFIAYLQTLKRSDGTKIVPSVYEMQATSLHLKKVHNCRVDFCPAVSFVDLPDDSEFSCLGLLRGFFKYYQNFAFHTYVVCPYLGIPVNRWSDVDPCDSSQIRNIMANFRNFYIKPAGRGFGIVQDPFNHQNILVCRGDNFGRIQANIAKGFSICELHFMTVTQGNELTRFLEKLFFYT